LSIPDSVNRIEGLAFDHCDRLTTLAIPNSVTNIGFGAFAYCGSLTNVTVPCSVTSVGDQAFGSCSNLSSIFFSGNAPSLGTSVFDGDDHATVYRLPGTTGWELFSAATGRPVVVWKPRVLTDDDSFGVRTNQFGFNISWASGMTVVVEGRTNVNSLCPWCPPPFNDWTPLQTNTLTSDTLYFSDPQWTNYPARFYRLRWP
jgi:hypothetical protein